MALQPVIWDRRGITNPEFCPKNIDRFVRAQLKEQIIQPPNITYTPVSWEDTLAQEDEAGPSSTDLPGAPFIVVCTFVRIARGRRADARAGVIIKASKSIIGLTPGQTCTPCSMMFPAAIFPPNAFESGVFSMADPTCHVGLLNEGLKLEYLLSYWKKTQITV